MLCRSIAAILLAAGLASTGLAQGAAVAKPADPRAEIQKELQQVRQELRELRAMLQKLTASLPQQGQLPAARGVAVKPPSTGMAVAVPSPQKPKPAAGPQPPKPPAPPKAVAAPKQFRVAAPVEMKGDGRIVVVRPGEAKAQTFALGKDQKVMVLSEKAEAPAGQQTGCCRCCCCCCKGRQAKAAAKPSAGAVFVGPQQVRARARQQAPAGEGYKVLRRVETKEAKEAAEAPKVMRVRKLDAPELPNKQKLINI